MLGQNQRNLTTLPLFVALAFLSGLKYLNSDGCADSGNDSSFEP